MTVIDWSSRLDAGVRLLARERVVWAVFSLQLALAATWLFHEGRGLTFYGDDWTFVLLRSQNNVVDFLAPHGIHLVVAAVLVYKAMLYAFGMNYVVFRVLAIGFHLVTGTLLYVIARRRVGGLLALVPAGLLLFLGPAWEDLLWAFQIGFLGALACGLGMLLALDRHDRIGDITACTLLILSIAFSGIGLAFLAGAAVDVLGRGSRWRRLWVMLVPLALYASWYALTKWYVHWWAVSAIHRSTTFHTFSTVASAAADSVGSLIGLGIDWGRPVTLVLALLLVRLLLSRQAPLGVWIATAMALGFWIPLGLAREEPSSRHIYPGAVFVLLIAIEALRGLRLRAGILGLALVAAVIVIWTNLGAIYPGRDIFHNTAVLVRAQLGAVELAKDVVPYSFSPDPGLNLQLDAAGVVAGNYLEAVRRFGSPAFTPNEVQRQSEGVREAADSVLVGALGVTLAPSEFRAAGSAPVVQAATSVKVTTAGACLRVHPRNTPGLTPTLDISVPQSGIGIRTTSPGGVSVALRQFADAFTTGLPAATAKSVALRIRGESPRLRWYAQLTPTGPTRVCTLAAR